MFAERREYGVRMGRPYEIAVDLVGDDENAVLQADITDPLQLLPCPYAADRIVRTAEQIELYAAADDLLFQIRKIDLIAASVEGQRAVDQSASEAFDQIAEGIIDGTVDEDAVAFFRKGTDRRGEGEDHAGSLDYPVRVDGKSEVGVKPRGECLKVAVVGSAVSEDSVFCPGMKRPDDRIRYAKIHIGDPERQELIRSAGAGIAGRGVFDGITVSAVDYGVETAGFSAVFGCFSVHGKYLRILCVCWICS